MLSEVCFGQKDRKEMKIAIHHVPGSFSDRWIEYCKENGIPYKIVNVYQPNIVQQVADCDAFMWHHHHGNYKDVLFAKQLLYSLQIAGKRVFPDFNTGWHFDDKVGQKYLLEAIGAPLVPSYVFYTKREAMEWIEKTTFPKVFKLRGGAGAMNVRLMKTKREAKRLVKQAFGRGFSQFNRFSYLKERYERWRRGKDTLLGVCKGVGRLVVPTEYAKMHAREKGYVYFQDFVPGNQFDVRIVVVGNKAFGLKRLVRKNDFRASGSGNIVYNRSEIDERCVRLAFEVAKKLYSQSIALDFVFDSNREPLIVEISYGYSVKAYYKCEGYWSDDMCWHEGIGFDIEGWIVEDLIR